MAYRPAGAKGATLAGGNSALLTADFNTLARLKAGTTGMTLQLLCFETTVEWRLDPVGLSGQRTRVNHQLK